MNDKGYIRKVHLLWNGIFFKVTKIVLFILLAGLLMAFKAYYVDEQILGSGKDLMNRTLFTFNKEIAWHTVLTRIIGPIICFNTGAAGGVFAPSLAAGTNVGGFSPAYLQ